jgi:hypothetical protein
MNFQYGCFSRIGGSVLNSTSTFERLNERSGGDYEPLRQEEQEEDDQVKESLPL